MDLIRSFHGKRGKIDLYFTKHNFAYYARPCGMIGVRLLRQYVAELKQLDQLHHRQYHHIVNTTHITVANPFNPFILRQIRKLSHIGWYIVIVPNPMLRLLIYLSRWINQPDFVFKSIDDCLAYFQEVK